MFRIQVHMCIKIDDNKSPLQYILSGYIETLRIPTSTGVCIINSKNQIIGYLQEIPTHLLLFTVSMPKHSTYTADYVFKTVGDKCVVIKKHLVNHLIEECGFTLSPKK